LKGDFLHYELKNGVLSVVDTQSAGKESIRELVEKSSDAVRNMCAPEEKIVVRRLLSEVVKQNGLATYGLDSVLTALRNGEAEVALVTDCTDMVEVVVMCKRCEHTRAKIVHRDEKVRAVQEMVSIQCERCGAVEYAVEEKDMVDVLEDLASRTNATVEVISTESEEKARLTSLGGFAALLRYKPK
jgi:peptide chain release factor subunit 1